MAVRQIRLGLTGSFISGKTELAHVFQRLGLYFFDLNDLANTVRGVGSPWYAQYRKLGLTRHFSCDGHKKTSYYLKVMDDPELFQKMMAIELPAVELGIEAMTSRIKRRHMVINWGYLYKYMGRVEFDHVIVFQSSREVLIKRVIERCREINTPITRAQVERLLKSIDMEPEPILEAVRAQMGDKVTVFDTSADDFGESKLSKMLNDLHTKLI